MVSLTEKSLESGRSSSLRAAQAESRACPEAGGCSRAEVGEQRSGNREGGALSTGETGRLGLGAGLQAPPLTLPNPSFGNSA